MQNSRLSKSSPGDSPSQACDGRAKQYTQPCSQPRYGLFLLLAWTGLPAWAAIPLALIVVYAAGVVSERLFIQPLLDKPGWDVSPIIATLGISIFLQNLALRVLGERIQNIPYFIDGTLVLYGVRIAWQRQLILATAVAVIALFVALLKTTRLGMALRATAEDRAYGCGWACVSRWGRAMRHSSRMRSPTRAGGRPRAWKSHAAPSRARPSRAQSASGRGVAGGEVPPHHKCRDDAQHEQDVSPGGDRLGCELSDFWRFNPYFMTQVYDDKPLSTQHVLNYMEHRPLEGFVFAISPFNFASIAGNLPTAPALMGNAVVWKPASSAVLPAYYIMKVLKEAGMPDASSTWCPDRVP